MQKHYIFPTMVSEEISQNAPQNYNDYKNVKDEILDRLNVMLQQEETTYHCEDYFSLSCHYQRKPESQQRLLRLSSSSSPSPSSSKKNDGGTEDEKNQEVSSDISSSTVTKSVIEKAKFFRSTSALSIVEECARLVTDMTLATRKKNGCISRSNSTELAKTISEDNQEEEGGTDTSRGAATPAVVVDPHTWVPWRFQMCHWAYTVANTFGFCRITVAIAFDLLDRYIAQRYCPSTSSIALSDRDHDNTDEKIITTAGAMSCRDFQRLSMTAFYLAAKVNSRPESITIDDMVDMSRGMFTLHDFQQTEQAILEELSWRISPPTAYHFLGELFQLWEIKMKMKRKRSSSKRRKKSISSSCYCSTCCPTVTATATTSAAAIQLSYWMTRSYQILEVALADAYFVKHMSSQLALAAMLVAGNDYGISRQDLDEFCDSFQEIRCIMDGYKNDDDHRDDNNSNDHEEQFSEIYDRLYSWPKGEISHQVQYDPPSPQYYQ